MRNYLLYKRLHFYIGNILRFITIPFNQFVIHPKEVRTIFGVSFSKDGSHHVIKTLQEYDNDKSIDYKQTSLYHFLKNFTPASICEFINNKGPNVCNLPLFIYPWGTFKKNEYGMIKNPQTSRFCGPSNDEFIKFEFERIIKLYNSIKQEGYKPWNFKNGFIGGTMLIKENGDRRFIVLQGNHRLAILSYLGHETIQVREVPRYLKKIKQSDISKIPAQLIDICDAVSAKKIFNLYFEEDGKHINGFMNKQKTQSN